MLFIISLLCHCNLRCKSKIEILGKVMKERPYLNVGKVSCSSVYILQPDYVHSCNNVFFFGLDEFNLIPTHNRHCLLCAVLSLSSSSIIYQIIIITMRYSSSRRNIPAKEINHHVKWVTSLSSHSPQPHTL